jgi:hypothetical protein
MKNHIEFIPQRGRFNQHFALDFTRTDPKGAKMTEGLTVFFVVLGSDHVIALSKMLVKLTPG